MIHMSRRYAADRAIIEAVPLSELSDTVPVLVRKIREELRCYVLSLLYLWRNNGCVFT